MNTIKNALNTIYAPSSVRAILNGKRRPVLEKAIELRDKFSIPVDAWMDIKSYIKNDTKEAASQSNTNPEKKVSA